MTLRRRQMRTAKELDTCSGRLPGDVEDDMLGKIDGQKRGTARGSPRRSRTAKASHISRRAMKLGCACEWGGSGRLSVDGSGQHNPNRSEDPWSRATLVARMAVFHHAGGLRLRTEGPCCRGEHEGWKQTWSRDGHTGSKLNRRVIREGPI
jgi:hypothetical protein